MDELLRWYSIELNFGAWFNRKRDIVAKVSVVSSFFDELCNFAASVFSRLLDRKSDIYYWLPMYGRGCQVDLVHPCILPGYLGDLVGKNQESIIPNRTDPLTACMGV
jgi:hypothetical protein